MIKEICACIVCCARLWINVNWYLSTFSRSELLQTNVTFTIYFFTKTTVHCLQTVVFNLLWGCIIVRRFLHYRSYLSCSARKGAFRRGQAANTLISLSISPVWSRVYWFEEMPKTYSSDRNNDRQSDICQEISVTQHCNAV